MLNMAIVNTHALREEELVDEADLDSLVREAIAQVCSRSSFPQHISTAKKLCKLYTHLLTFVQIIDDVPFATSKAGQWSANIVEGCLKRLAESSKPFK